MTALGAAVPPARFRTTARTLDTALRYFAVVRLMGERWSPNPRVLEVGSGSGGVTEFLSHPVTGVDPAFERTAARSTGWLTPITGSAEALPFDDSTFDLVLSVEVLEHLPPEVRQRALREMVRVLRPDGRLIVTFPSGATAARLDKALNDAHRKRFGVDHPWAIEHLQHGVPDAPRVVGELRDSLGREATVSLLPHGWAPAWWFQAMALAVGRFRPFTYPLRSNFAARLLFLVLRRLNFSPAYRAILVVDKAGEK
jgi:SAM-dependent methyltransferase